MYSEATKNNNIEQQQQQWTLEFYSNFLCNTKMHATASHQEMLLKKFEGCQDCEKYNSFVRNVYLLRLFEMQKIVISQPYDE